MMRQATRRQVAQTTSIPAPIKGLNAKDAIANMDPTFALSLDNCFCTPTTVDIRRGQRVWSTGLPSFVETLAHYIGASVSKQFAVSNGSIYDISSSGPVGSAMVSGLGSSRFQTCQFQTPGGQFLYMVDGISNPQLYDGTNWYSITSSSTPYAITGVTPSSLVHVNAFQNRLYFVESNSMHVWYLPLQSISGAASKFDLSSIFTRGGYLMAMMTWTIDNTAGVQDYAVFITSEGEVAMYSGYDPSFASSFTLVGRFFMGRPIGRRCFTKLGSDNVVICADGVVTLSKELTTDRDLSSALSYNIQNLINDDVAAYATNFGWEPVYYPLGNKLIINVPAVADSVVYQYVMNTITGAWSSWNKISSGFLALCWDIYEDNAFCGGNGVVYQADFGNSDNGSAILADIKPAFSYFGDPGRKKRFLMARPIWSATGTVTPNYILDLDFSDAMPATPSSNVGGSAPWNTSPWNITPWGVSQSITKRWLKTGGLGYAASFRQAISARNLSASLQSIDYVYEAGGVI